MNIIKCLERISDTLIEHAEMLTELDRKIGDGDHGINLKRGFGEIKAALPSYEGKTNKEVCMAMAMILMSKVGGSSGPLLATAFMKAAPEENLPAMLSAAVAGIQMRGKAEVGEKTMVDVLRPAADTLARLTAEGVELKEAMAQVLQEAQTNLDHTKDIIATKGRASYLGERSIGTHDPGAYSSFLILRSINECIEDAS